jgi:hypothetical protein
MLVDDKFVVSHLVLNRDGLRRSRGTWGTMNSVGTLVEIPFVQLNKTLQLGIRCSLLIKVDNSWMLEYMNCSRVTINRRRSDPSVYKRKHFGESFKPNTLHTSSMTPL